MSLVPHFTQFNVTSSIVAIGAMDAAIAEYNRY
jgi:hypothetical protein